MLSISHALTGAFVASKLPHPGLYVPIAVGLHYLEDWIPHWDVGTGLSNGKRSKVAAVLLELVDLAIAGGLIYLFWQMKSPINFEGIFGRILNGGSFSGISESGILWHIWFGALAGLLPDFIEAPRNFLNIEPWLTKPLNKFHGRFHHSIPNVIKGLLPQILLVGAIWWLR